MLAACDDVEVTCGKWMPRRRDYCARAPQHSGSCATREGLTKSVENRNQWRRDNPDRVRGHYKTYRANNVESVAAYRREYKSRPEVRAREQERSKAHDAHIKHILDSIKLTAGCIDCGYREHPVAMDFDHLPGTKKLFNVSQALWRPLATILAEIEKCEVVCANCHRIRTYRRMREEAT